MMEYRNPTYNARGTIDVEVNHPTYGWIPFTASPDDVEGAGRALHAAILASGNDIAAYVPVDPEPAPLLPLTARQLRLGLVTNGVLPAQVDAAIAVIPDDAARAVAEIEWEYASQFDRDHPLIEQVGMALGLTPEQIDTMWEAALHL